MQSIIIKSLLILFNLIQWLIVFLSGFAIMFPLHQEQIETSKYGIGHYWFLITVFALWRFFKRFLRYILLKDFAFKQCTSIYYIKVISF